MIKEVRTNIEVQLYQCYKCGIKRPLNRFIKLAWECRDCKNLQKFLKYHNDPIFREKRINGARKWRDTEEGKIIIKKNNSFTYWKDPEASRAKTRETRRRLWDTIFEIYGKVCTCCGEQKLKFLTIDHVNNDGKADRKKFGSSPISFYTWLSKQEKLECYRILCYNCNLGRQRNKGICPHKEDHDSGS